MKKGTFLIVNEPTDETVDRMLQVPKDKCDVYPALVYIPKYNKKMEKGLFCLLTIFAQIALYGLMAYFFKVGYLAMIPFEVFFLTMYAKEYVTTLHVQFVYLVMRFYDYFVPTDFQI
ncbi:hypothetical protein CAEBREN_23691 [Caenorhabditis brenneri]|uniref:Uncharacterized protein n=1 Tax=Caenorhabditis brenneri TaxID=135651 RepID=G0P8P3_CAEBE|nr:hypothetical protein CAEBREN_23691 [Caenorhabditis brenneri]